MMDADVKQLWVEALRSGKYSQTRGRLRDEDGFCPLGVLCDLNAQYAPEEMRGAWEEDMRFSGCLGVLPYVVINWAGLPAWDSHGNLPDNTILPWYNDGRVEPFIRRHTLAEIADIIEANF
jgi:hypothetical protein